MPLPQTINMHYQIKITFIQGLQKIVLREIASQSKLQTLQLVQRQDDALYFSFGDTLTVDTYSSLSKIQSVTNVFLVQHREKLHPHYIYNHKSVLGDMVQMILDLDSSTILPTSKNSKKKFKTFKIRCAGSDSVEVSAIQKYISETYRISPVQTDSTNRVTESNTSPVDVSQMT